MRKLHWFGLALISVPFAVMGACGGDDDPGHQRTLLSFRKGTNMASILQCSCYRTGPREISGPPVKS